MEIQGNIAARLTSDGVDGRRLGAARANVGNADGAGVGSKAAEGARVELSEKARSMMALRSEVNNSPDVRETRVADISGRIAAGTYTVKGQVVATAMVRQAAFEAVA